MSRSGKEQRSIEGNVVDPSLIARWRAALDRAAACAGLAQKWMEPQLPQFDTEATCLYVVDEFRDIALRAEHSAVTDFSIAVSSRDTERRSGRIAEVGAWMQLSADIGASERHAQFVEAALQVFLMAVQLDLDVRAAEQLVRLVADGFYDGEGGTVLPVERG